MISIEQATARDADAICRIDATVLGDIGRNGQLRQWIAAGQCYAARQDGEVVGYAVMDQSFFRQSFVELIVVHPRHQRKGIGEALFLLSGAGLFEFDRFHYPVDAGFSFIFSVTSLISAPAKSLNRFSGTSVITLYSSVDSFTNASFPSFL